MTLVLMLILIYIDTDAGTDTGIGTDRVVLTLELTIAVVLTLTVLLTLTLVRWCGFFLAWEDLGKMFDHSFPACVFFFFSFFFFFFRWRLARAH